MEALLPEPRWEHFPHDADVGIRGLGPTPEAAFEQAALALKEVVTTAEVAPNIKVEVSCEAPDRELLFIDWLNADRKSTRLNSSHIQKSRMPSSA